MKDLSIDGNIIRGVSFVVYPSTAAVAGLAAHIAFVCDKAALVGDTIKETLLNES